MHSEDRSAVTTELIVVGGAYVEICAFPRSSLYRGSGVRAASVLAGLGNRVTLHMRRSQCLR